MEELNELRKIAEAATQGNWMWVNDRTPELIRAGKFPYTHVTYTDDVIDENSLHIATFDPPAVLALLTRLEQAEQDRVKLRNRLDAMRRQRDGYRNQLRKARTNQGENK